MKYFWVLTAIIWLLFSFQGSSSAEKCGMQAGGVGDDEIPITESNFEEMLLHRNNYDCPARGFYTYDDFISAVKAFPGFGTYGNDTIRKREIAAFFGQTSHETKGGWSGALDGPYAWGYCYYWNTTGDRSFKSALSFWMTTQPPKPSSHDVITGIWKPTEADIVANRKSGYGVITNIFDGGECGWNATEDGEDRIGFYRRHSTILGVDMGENLDCYDQKPFGSGLLLNTM